MPKYCVHTAKTRLNLRRAPIKEFTVFVCQQQLNPYVFLVFFETLGLCTNHVDRIQGIFDPPLPLVDEHRHLADPPLKPRRHFKYPPLVSDKRNFPYKN